jgi:ribosome-associated toxin RatA of RatAB toxin-antitoxin module
LDAFTGLAKWNISFSALIDRTHCITSWLTFMLLLACSNFSFAFCDSASEKQLQIDVVQSGEIMAIDASLFAPVSQHLAWEVLTDYDNMAAFLPRLESSRIIEKNPRRILVTQRGKLPVGPFSLNIWYEREIHLTQFTKLESHVTSGAFKNSNVTTRLIKSGTGTCIVYHSEIIPNFNLPFGIGVNMARSNVEEQLHAIRAEMMRRQSRIQDATGPS